MYGVMLYTFPLSTVHASLPFLPVYCRSSEGVTLRYGVEGGSPRILELGLLDMEAQSRGEWPGASSTLFRGLVGMELCVGGGWSDDGRPAFGERLTAGERRGGVRSMAERRGG
jgi:hypothetical protein